MSNQTNSIKLMDQWDTGTVDKDPEDIVATTGGSASDKLIHI